MSISWREILGLLVGLAICYGVISYAVTNGPQIREIASEQARESSRGGTTGEQTTEGTDGETKTVTVRVTGPRGYEFGANYGNLLSSETVEGTVPADYEVRVRTDPSTGDHVYATAWKTTGDTSKELKIQVLDGGTVLKEHSTKKDYGATSVRWSPNEPPPAETTTPGTQKAAGQKAADQKGAIQKGVNEPKGSPPVGQ